MSLPTTVSRKATMIRPMKANWRISIVSRKGSTTHEKEKKTSLTFQTFHWIDRSQNPLSLSALDNSCITDNQMKQKQTTVRTSTLNTSLPTLMQDSKICSMQQVLNKDIR